jgi:small acid-soluble spore protein F (minor alpha/beta-type SASP)
MLMDRWSSSFANVAFHLSQANGVAYGSAVFCCLMHAQDRVSPQGAYYEREYSPCFHFKEAVTMSRRKRGIMSEELKYELAKDLGFYDTVREEGWGGIKAKDAGNMVKRAIQLAEQAASRNPRQ